MTDPLARPTLDDVLDRLAPMSPEYAGELSDHAPMVAESLDRLGRLDALAPFLDAWLPKLRRWGDQPEPAIAAYPALRDAARVDIEKDGAPAAVRAWFERAGEGVAGAAFHGVIRIAHALTGLGRSDSDARRDELARALAYAETRATCIEVGAPHEETRPFADVLRGIAILPPPTKTGPGLISTALEERVAEHPTFARDAASFTLADDSADALRELRALAIDVFLRGAYPEARTFTMLHAVTGMDACARIAGDLAPPAAARMAAAAARALLAMRVAFVGAYPGREPEPATARFEALTGRAVATLNDHAIKLAATLARADDVPEEARAATLETWVRRVEPRAVR